MKFYYVDPPSFEGEGDGEDHREWFSSREAAERKFNEWARRIRQHDKEGRQSNWNGEYTDDLNIASVSLGVVDVKPTKQGLLTALNRHFFGERLKFFPDDGEK